MKHWFVVLFIFGSFLPAFAEETLSWTAVAAQVPKHQTVVLASAALAIAQDELQAELNWKGLKVSARPATEFTSADLGLDFVFPLGTTEAEREKKTQLTEIYDLRLREAEEASGSATLDLFRSYSATYLAQEAVQVAVADRDWVAAKLQAVRQRVQQGTLTASAGLAAEADFQDAEAALTQARLDLRLAWFSLAFKANLETPRGDHDPGSKDPLGLVPHLEKPVQETLPSLGLPIALITSAKQRASAALAQNQKIARAERALADAGSLDLSFAPQVNYAMEGSSLALGFSSSTGTISLGGDWSVYQAPATTTVIKTTSPVLTASLLLTLDLPGGVAARNKGLAEALELEHRRLGYIEATLELAVRSRYAAYLKAQDSLAESQRSILSAKSTTEAFATKKNVGQATPEDEAANAALMVRTAFNDTKAQVSLTLAYFELMEAASAWEKT